MQLPGTRNYTMNVMCVVLCSLLQPRINVSSEYYFSSLGTAYSQGTLHDRGLGWLIYQDSEPGHSLLQLHIILFQFGTDRSVYISPDLITQMSRMLQVISPVCLTWWASHPSKHMRWSTCILLITSLKR